MTYLEKIKRNQKEYFYLTKNIRISKNKWKKVRIYLGDKKPTKKQVEQKTKEIEKQVEQYKSDYSYLKKEDAETLQDLKEGYKAYLKEMPKSAREKLNKDFMIRFTYNTNAIEGNRLTLRQTALILKDKVIPTGIRASDYHEALNGKEVLDYFKQYKGDFNKKQLLTVNRTLTQNTGVVYSGKIRWFNVSIEGSQHVPPDKKEVEKHVSNLFKWYLTNKNKLHPFELACLIHAKIAWIHPFEDGNGRTSRAIMNFILIKKGFPMFFIPYEKREEYYSALEDYDAGNLKRYISKMLGLIIDQVRSYGHKQKK